MEVFNRAFEGCAHPEHQGLAACTTRTSNQHKPGMMLPSLRQCSHASTSQPCTQKTEHGRPSKRRVHAYRTAGPTTPCPDYTAVDQQPINKAVMALFRRKMVQAIGSDSNLQGYGAIIDLTRRLNGKYTDPRTTQLVTRGILQSLFPSWLPGAFAVMFSKPLPALSCRLNAWATAALCQWLMGPSTLIDTELDDGTVGEGMGVQVERCRYLEQAGCASVCLNSCKVPTQEFFMQDMGLPLTMTPNYEDFSCTFAFGKTPLSPEQDEAFTTQCFLQCPTKRPSRLCGTNSSSNSLKPPSEQGEL